MSRSLSEGLEKRDVLSKSSKENNSRRGSEGVGVIRGVSFLTNK